MKANARQVLDRARRIIHDEESTRWWLPELAQWLTDGVRQIGMARPEALAVGATLNLVQGTRQELPGEYFHFLRAVHNIPDATKAITGRAIRMVKKEQLEEQEPHWHDPTIRPFKSEVRHVAFDPGTPRVYWCYPGNNGLGQIHAEVAQDPTEIVVQADADLIDSYDAITLPVDGIYTSALADFVVYRAFSKDAHMAPASAQRAQVHLAAFQAAIGLRTAASDTENPNTPFMRG